METTLTIPSGVNNFYDRAMLERAKPALLHTLFGQIRDIPRNNSDVIKFRRYNALTAATTPLNEGVTPVGSALSVTSITAQVQQYGDFVTLSDKLLFTTQDPILTETAELLGEQVGLTLDTLMRDVLVAGSTNQFASTATTIATVAATMVLTTAEVADAIMTLKLAKAKKITSMVNPDNGYDTTPVNSCFVGIIHPKGTKNLADEAVATKRFVSVEHYANKANLLPNEVGYVDEVRFMETTEAKVYTGLGNAGIDVYVTLIIGANAYGVSRISGEALTNIVKAPGSGDDPLNQRSTSGWKATFVGKVLNSAWIVAIHHAIV